MDALEKFKQLGYKRKQNNKYNIKYIKIDTKYWGEYTDEGTEVHHSITFCKQTKTVTLESVLHSLDINKKTIYSNMHFYLNGDLLEAINEQLAEIEK